MNKRVVTTSALFALLVLLYGTSSSYACSCMGPKPPCQALWEADAVLQIYEGVSVGLQAQVDVGNGKRVSSDWLEVPDAGDMTGIKLVIPSHLIPN